MVYKPFTPAEIAAQEAAAKKRLNSGFASLVTSTPSAVNFNTELKQFIDNHADLLSKYAIALLPAPGVFKADDAAQRQLIDRSYAVTGLLTKDFNPKKFWEEIPKKSLTRFISDAMNNSMYTIKTLVPAFKKADEDLKKLIALEPKKSAVKA